MSSVTRHTLRSKPRNRQWRPQLSLPDSLLHSMAQLRRIDDPAQCAGECLRILEEVAANMLGSSSDLMTTLHSMLRQVIIAPQELVADIEARGKATAVADAVDGADGAGDGVITVADGPSSSSSSSSSHKPTKDRTYTQMIAVLESRIKESAAKSNQLEIVMRKEQAELTNLEERVQAMQKEQNGKDVKRVELAREESKLMEEIASLKDRYERRQKDVEAKQAEYNTLLACKVEANHEFNKRTDLPPPVRRDVPMSNLDERINQIQTEMTRHRERKRMFSPEEVNKMKTQLELVEFRIREKEVQVRQDAAHITNTIKVRDELMVQVEILEQAVLVMKYMVDEAMDELSDADMAALDLNLHDIESSDNDSEHTGPPKSHQPFAALGTGDEIPLFLRAELGTQIRNYGMAKHHVELFIKEIWALKIIYDDKREQNGHKRSILPEYFNYYLEERFDDREKLLELSYNFVNAMEHYRYDGDVELFYRVLLEGVSEDFYYDQMAMVAHLKNSLVQMDMCDGVRDGLIHKNVFFHGMRQFFPIKTVKDMEEINTIVFEENIVDNQVDTRSLLAESSSGDQSEFMETVRQQYLDEVFSFPQLIEDTLNELGRTHGKQMVDEKSNSDELVTHVSAGQVMAVLHELDTNKEPAEIRQYMARGLGLHSDVFLHGFDRATEFIPLQPFITSLRSTVLHRTGHYFPDLNMTELAELIPKHERLHVPKSKKKSKPAPKSGGGSGTIHDEHMPVVHVPGEDVMDVVSHIGMDADDHEHPDDEVIEDAVKILEDYL